VNESKFLSLGPVSQCAEVSALLHVSSFVFSGVELFVEHGTHKSHEIYGTTVGFIRISLENVANRYDGELFGWYRNHFAYNEVF